MCALPTLQLPAENRNRLGGGPTLLLLFELRVLLQSEMMDQWAQLSRGDGSEAHVGESRFEHDTVCFHLENRFTCNYQSSC